MVNSNSIRLSTGQNVDSVFSYLCAVRRKALESLRLERPMTAASFRLDLIVNPLRPNRHISCLTRVHEVETPSVG